MLYEKVVRAYTHTLRLHMMCTLFLVYTYVIHSYVALHVALLYDCLFLPFIFKFFFWYIQTVYTAYEHCISLEFHWNMTYWHMLPDIRHFNKYTSLVY